MGVEASMTNMVTGTVGTDVPQAAPQPEVAPVQPEVAVPEALPEQERPRADRFAVLARKEAELHRQRQAIRQQQAELARQADEIRAFQEAKRGAVTNPIEALRALGLSYDDVTKYVLNENQPTPDLEIKSLRQELEEFKQQARQEQEQTREQQKIAMQREQAAIIEQFRAEVADYVREHAETYELTNLYNGAHLVSGVIEEHFEQTKKLLSNAEAAKLVEEYFEDLARKAQATKKFAVTQQEAARPQVQQAAPAPKLGPTLSNDLGAIAAANSQRPRTDADRIAAALARLEGR